jgi:uncharacterized OsmC-like protein
MSENQVSVSLRQQQDYRFEVSFDEQMPPLISDEPAPLGTGAGPSPVQMLCAAVGNCLSDSLLFAYRKFKQQPEPLQCVVTAEVGRNSENRLRVLNMNARLQVGVPAAALEQTERVMGQFEAFCTVTQSVGQGIPIRLEVFDSEGQRLK